jgi:tripartite-type tricarboxylate transporter receptor subunit TctC
MFAAATHAQNYPAKPVRVITPFTAGSAIDTLARVLGQKLGDTWGQQVVIDNRIGANGIIGTEAAAKAPPDGYTVYLGNISTLAVNPHLYLKLPYDALRDFAPVTLAATIPVVLVVHPSLPVKSVRELIALAKAHPGQLNYASGGTGSAQHLPMEMLRVDTGINIVHVPYKGGAPAVADLLGGHVAMLFTGAPVTMSHIKAGKLKILAVTDSKRVGALPDVPTVGESLPGYEFNNWYGFLAPLKLPRALVDKVNADLARVLALPDVKERFTTLGADITPSTPERFGTVMKADAAKWGKVVKAAGIKAD